MIKTCEHQGKCKHKCKHKCEGERKGNVHRNMEVYVGVNVKECECQGGMGVWSVLRFSRPALFVVWGLFFVLCEGGAGPQVTGVAPHLSLIG